jgi:hypothetical protein
MVIADINEYKGGVSGKSKKAAFYRVHPYQ